MLTAFSTDTRCGTPGCKSKRGYGLFASFCRKHAKALAKIRAEFEAETSSRCPSIANKQKRFQRQPVCCNPYCNASRTPPAAFCDSCVAEGYVEEAA